MRKLSMNKISELLRQRYALARSYREISASLNISVGTIADYLSRANAAGLKWPLPNELTEQQLYEQLFLPSQSARKKPAPSWADVHREYRKKGVTLLLLWREYRERQPDGLGYTRFCQGYQQYASTLTPVMRQVHKGGEKVFVDYAGMTMPWIEPSTGEVHEAQIFVASLGASQYTFAQASASQQLPDWLESHDLMFAFFGGVSEVIVPDNLKSAVTKSHRYDPDLNANYQHFSEHYGVAIVPARARAPKDKAKVENAVGCIERQVLAPLRHHTFTSLTDLNAAISKGIATFNQQRFQKMDTSRAELFEKLDKPALKPLPKTAYQYATWCKATVNIDYHIVFDHHYYSVPHRYIRNKIKIRATQKTVECLYQGQRIALHQRSRQRYGFSTRKEHMPTAHLAHVQWTPERLTRWAQKTGAKTGEFIKTMIAAKPFPQQAFRACLGLLRLSKRFGNERLEKACARALAIGATRYQQVEAILKNNMENVSDIDHTLTHTSSHTNIRGAQYYE